MEENILRNVSSTELKRKNINITYITLPLLIICVLIIVYLFLRISQVDSEFSGKDERLKALGLEMQQTKGQLLIANSNLEKLTTSIEAYLKAEGRSCNGDKTVCLKDLTDQLKAKVGLECSILQDNVCPEWCAKGSDYDCCIKDPGFEWIQGRGCFSK